MRTEATLQPTKIKKNQSFVTAAPNLLSLIGSTPLLRLSQYFPLNVFAKLEYFNPGGSIKDRTAAYMIDQAEKKGLLKPSGTIIEASSGNQGIALAMIGALKGYNVIITIPTRTSIEKKNTMLSYGAQIIVCDESKGEDYRERALQLAQEIPNSFMPDQYFNPDNSAAHYASTGPEIWQQTNGSVTHVVVAAGSCGTITGIGRYLKEKNKNIKIIGVDAATSAYSSKDPQPYQTEGLGIDYVDGLFDTNVVDQIIPVTDEQAFSQARTMSQKHGLLIGPSSGAVICGAEQIIPSLDLDSVVILILADSGRAYLSKLFTL
jgi:cystathionine beta-synthase